MSAVAPRGLTIREARFIAEKTKDPSVSDRQALLTAGFPEYIAERPASVVSDQMRAHIEKLRVTAVNATLAEAGIDAAEVLRELVRQLARLTVQAQRLHSDMGHDIAEIYTPAGLLAEVKEWPAIWRTRLITEIESKEFSERSHDGATKDKEGGWDKVGTIRKVKRESTIQIERTLLGVEREIRDCLERIGAHITVKAWDTTQKVEITERLEVVNLAAVCTLEQLEQLRAMTQGQLQAKPEPEPPT